ncbi:MAG: hypothetical protein U0V74_12660 [Chitinophagales bacterium]
MKEGLLIPLLFIALVWNMETRAQSATDKANKRFSIKYSPLAFVISQTPYCSDLPLSFEYRISNRHSVLLTAGASIPKASYLLVESLFAASQNTLIMYGGRGSAAYRYYVKPSANFGVYIGAEVQCSGYVAPKSKDGTYTGYGEWSWHSPSYTMHGIMTNYNFTTGYQFTSGKAVIDVGVSIGGRYHYFWRHYALGNLEVSRDSGLYRYYKLSPLGGSFNFAVGGLF